MGKIKEWKQTLDKVNKDEKLDGTDWWVLRGLVNSFLVFGKKKQLKKALLMKLYSQDEALLDEEMKFTIRCISRRFIVVTCVDHNGKIENIRLVKRTLPVPREQVKEEGYFNK